MYNVLIDGVPTQYKGYSINTDYRVALRIQEILEDPRLKKDSEIERMAAYMVAISLLFEDDHVEDDNKLGLYESIQALFWWLSCGKTDQVENYWKRTGIMPDIDDNAFDPVDYKNGVDEYIDIEDVDKDGKRTLKKVTKYSVLSFTAPDGTTRYVKKANGDKELVSLYEDAEFIYSGFYKIFHIDLATTKLHWFTFCYLLSELEATENTALANKIKLRSFNPADYKGKNYAEYRNKMSKAQHANRVLGILPYVDGGS